MKTKAGAAVLSRRRAIGRKRVAVIAGFRDEPSPPFHLRRSGPRCEAVPERVFPMNSLPKPAQRQSMAGARLRKHADYQRAYAASRKRQSASMSWFLAASTQNRDDGQPSGARIGLTAGKVLGKANERNRIKRRIREALRRHLDLLPAGFDLILHPRRSVLTLEFAKLEAEIVRVLGQARDEALRARPTIPGVPRGAVKPAS